MTQRWKIFPRDRNVLISRTPPYQIQPQIVWYVLSEAWEEEETLSPHHCVWLHLSPSTCSQTLIRLSFTDLSPLPSVSVSLKGSICLSVIPYHLSDWDILDVFVVHSASGQYHSTKRPCQEHIYLFILPVQECMQWCLSWKSVHNVWIHMYVCVSAFICGVVLPFPAVSMFKASSCAVRMCLSLFSKNTCSAFYQRAELGWPGTVQGWAQIIKHQQILIHPDWNWLCLFCWAGLVWLGLVGHAGITVLECGGLVLLRDWRLFVVRCNWSWYWIRTDGDIPGDVRFVLTHQVSPSLS